MQTFLCLFAVAATAAAVWALRRRLSAPMTLLSAGLAVLLACAAAGRTGFLPEGVPSSGVALFDVFLALRAIASRSLADIGLLIMTAGGFAAYMDRIGASRQLAETAVRPLRGIRAPYAVLALGYLAGQSLVLAIPSAAGLAMLLLVCLFPVLRAAGVSAASAAAVIATSAGVTFAPATGTASLAAQVSGMDPIVYLVQCQLPVAVPALLAACLSHCLVQRRFDLLGVDADAAPPEVPSVKAPRAPVWYALFPVLPVVLLIGFSPLAERTADLDTVSALLLVWAAAVCTEAVRHRNLHKVFRDGASLFQSMGKMFGGTVALIVCAEFFAAGLKASGLIDVLLSCAQGAGAGVGTMSAVLAGIVSLVTFLTGSGVSAFASFAALAPEAAQAVGGTVQALVTPMQFASGMVRSMSPVAGVVIAAAGAAGISPLALVRRTAVPMAAGLTAALAANWILLA